ncbi:hypothetical protein GOODEAATRI_023731 [Goodea atripinnis]|uniref:Uncharacterized protein n=1 Tax=Goodea atripinnis TaxID=208336 RepID=A0ABV0PGI2_9TELE
MSKSDMLRGIITEKLSTAAREILAVVERTVTDYEKEASAFRQEIDRQRRQLELLQPQEMVFLDLLRSTFPQLAAGEPFDIFIADKSRSLKPLAVKTPEEICRARNQNLYVCLKVKPDFLLLLENFMM